ncbi:MAG: capsular biosynthesis protein [Pseudomonadota bacterium]|nr:capsular biosynthesis protein [Pseudomonadota bacterium]
MDASLAMARMAVDNGIKVMAATPHFLPGVYDSESADVRNRLAALQSALQDAQIPLKLVSGCDAHIRPDFTTCLRDGRILTLNDTRYVLFEPPHTSLPPRMDELLHNVVASGFVPILTHPERLRWIEQSYDLVIKLVEQGTLMQITAGSLTGRFGARPQYWAQRMLSEGLVHILATDAHDTKQRPPSMIKAHEIAVAELGLDEAKNLVLIRPAMILINEPVEGLPPTHSGKGASVPAKRSFLNRFFGRRK